MERIHVTSIYGGSKYRHFKNKMYEVIGAVSVRKGNEISPNMIKCKYTAIHTETGKEYTVIENIKNKPMDEVFTITDNDIDDQNYVLYKSLYDDKIYIRPTTMFFSDVDKDKYPDVEQKERFKLIEKGNGRYSCVIDWID